VHTEHLDRFGAYEIPRADYLARLKVALDEPPRRGRWAFEIDQAAFAASGREGGGGRCQH
jgi:Leu/Phe-tRNA-protein transferase